MNPWNYDEIIDLRKVHVQFEDVLYDDGGNNPPPPPIPPGCGFIRL